MKTFEKDGKKLFKIGDREVEFTDFNENGEPIIKPKITRQKKDGKDEVIIEVPTLKIINKKK